MGTFQNIEQDKIFTLGDFEHVKTHFKDTDLVDTNDWPTDPADPNTTEHAPPNYFVNDSLIPRAIRGYDRILGYAPHHHVVGVYKVFTHLLEGRYEETKKLITIVSAWTSSAADTKFKLNIATFLMKQLEESPNFEDNYVRLKILKEARTSNQFGIFVRIMIGKMLEKYHHYKDALRVYNYISETQLRGLVAKALCYFKMRRFEDVLNTCKKILENERCPNSHDTASLLIVKVKIQKSMDSFTGELVKIQKQRSYVDITLKFYRF